jgi:hypothetical protein
LFGQNTWVVPVIADNGKFQTLALVQATNGRVVVGNASAPSAAADAFSTYRDLLGGRIAGSGSAEGVTGVVDRVAQGGSSIYFTVRGNERVFVLRDAANPAALLMHGGDRVKFVIQGEDANSTSIRDFQNLSLGRH